MCSRNIIIIISQSVTHSWLVVGYYSRENSLSSSTFHCAGLLGWCSKFTTTPCIHIPPTPNYHHSHHHQCDFYSYESFRSSGSHTEYFIYFFGILFFCRVHTYVCLSVCIHTFFLTTYYTRYTANGKRSRSSSKRKDENFVY